MGNSIPLIAEISNTVLAGIVVAGLVAIVLLIIVAQFFGLWLQAYFSNADVRFAELIGMKLRKVDSKQVVTAKIQDRKSVV